MIEQQNGERSGRELRNRIRLGQDRRQKNARVAKKEISQRLWSSIDKKEQNSEKTGMRLDQCAQT